MNKTEHRKQRNPPSRLTHRASLITFPVDHPRAVIIGVAALTVFFLLGFLRGLPLDVSPLAYVERQSQQRTDFDAARRSFGDDLYLVVAVVCDDVFAPANLARLRALHERIEQLQGASEIISLANVPYARSIHSGVSLEKLIPEVIDVGPTDGSDHTVGGSGAAMLARLAEARAVATTDRLYVGHLVSRDAQTAALSILLKPELPTTARHEMTHRIYELARHAGFREVYFAGDPFSQWRGTEAIKRDLTLFLPLTLALIAVLLWVCFRSLVAVLLPLLTIGTGLVWLFGLMALVGARFTIIALMLPTLLLAIGCSYMIHVLNQVGIVHEANGQNHQPAEIVRAALGFIALPVIVSALTIIAGFLSLAFTPIPGIRETAIYAALGAAFTLILSLSFLPAALVLIGPRAVAMRVGLGGNLVRSLERVGRWATTHQSWLYLATGVIVIASLIGMQRVKIDIDYYHFFKPSSEASVGIAEIGRRLAGAISFEIIISGDRSGAIEDPQALASIARLQQFAESGGRVADHTLSVVDFVKHLNRAFHDNDPQYYAIPSETAVIRELLADKQQLASFITQDGRSARILVRSMLSGSSEMSQAVMELEQRGRELLPGWRVFATGTIVLMNRTSDRIAGDQRQSIMIALLTIYAMLALLFRSWRVGLTALVPNLIPVLFFFGFMGWRAIPLNLTTSLVASVVLGLAVDNAVQFIVRFRRVQAEGWALREAIIHSLRLSGRPIIYANVALAATFAIFAFSDFAPVGSFGLLSAATILGCLVEDLILLPARLTSPVFIAAELKTDGATGRQGDGAR